MAKKGFNGDGKTATRNERIFALAEKGVMRTRSDNIKRNRKIWFFKNHFTECQLYRGDDKFPRTKQMTIRQMGRTNKALTFQFIKSLDEGVEKALWGWRLVDSQEFRALLKNHMNTDHRHSYEIEDVANGN